MSNAAAPCCQWIRFYKYLLTKPVVLLTQVIRLTHISLWRNLDSILHKDHVSDNLYSKIIMSSFNGTGTI